MDKRYITILVALAVGSISALAQPAVGEKDRQRAADLVSKMTLEEKCALVSGIDDGFHTFPVERLGIPSVRMADGPQGVRNDTRSTYYPCGMAVASSWNRDVAFGVGSGIGWDARARGVGIMLCPGVNIYRSALCGRNFEYYGEDPYLASETAVQCINGIQSKGVVSTIKHFALNNQEYHRYEVSSDADERTIHEIYFPAFRNAVEKAHVGAVMTSYNPVNHVHAAENGYITGCLREWGHEGIIMSDWESTYTTLGCYNSGLDLEMPKGFVLNYAYIKPLLDRGVISEDRLDEKCRHILQLFSAYGFLDAPVLDSSIPEDYEPSRANAYSAALEGVVLLKNDGILPIHPSRRNNIVVMGPNADVVAFGGGSGEMHPIEGRAITLLAGLKALGKGYKISTTDWKNPDEALIRSASTIIYAAGFNDKIEREGSDRPYALPQEQNESIAAVAALNPNVVVVANSGGEFALAQWKDSVKAILLPWYGGQETGNALAALISGRETPSGKLPFTWWGTLEKNPAQEFYAPCKPYPAEKRWKDFRYTFYAEGIFVGYRGVERFGVAPDYPFGFGLSYTSFEYSDLKIAESADGYDLSLKVKNTGKLKGAEAVQVYVSELDPSVQRPAMELKGYDKVSLAPGKSAEVSIHLPHSAFEHYCTASHGWKADSGEYRILVGASSADIRLESKITLK